MSYAILCDFDGTVTLEDLGDQISKQFAGHGVWRAAQDRYKAGEFPFAVLLRRIFEPINAKPEDLAGFARRMAVLRSGFTRLLGVCRDQRIPFIVCSAGLDIYIEPVLEQLPADLRAYIQVRANRAVVTAEGLRLHFPGEGTGCGKCGSCKGPVVDELQAAGYRVVLCGDGTTDRCAAHRADVVFACGKLPQYCAANGIPHVQFESFDEVVEGLRLVCSAPAAVPDGT